jgi:predicted RNase H-like HicB family nuclease
MDLRKEAEKLAARPYTTLTIKDLTTSGDPVVLALSPELEGCIGQGATEELAVANLALARVDFIQSLLEDGLPVPAPQSSKTTTTSGQTANYTNIRASRILVGKFDPIKPDPVASKVTRLVGASLGM